MIALDTGPLVALFDKEDDKHLICLNVFKEIKEPLITTWPVLTEAFYLLNFSPRVQDDLWEFIERDIVTIHHLETKEIALCRDLMKKYKDVPMDLADASLMAMAEMKNISTIFTLDKDFDIYRTKRGRHLRSCMG